MDTAYVYPNLLEAVGAALEDLYDGGDQAEGETPDPEKMFNYWHLELIREDGNHLLTGLYHRDIVLEPVPPDGATIEGYTYRRPTTEELATNYGRGYNDND